MYVVDTNVLSAGAPSRMPRPATLLNWMHRNSPHLFVSVITVAEVEDGIAKSTRTGASRKADALRAWLNQVLHEFRDRILPIDLAVARVIGQLSDRARASGHTPELADLAIASTALHHGYVVLTRNLRHFLPLAVAYHDPFETLPGPS